MCLISSQLASSSGDTNMTFPVLLRLLSPWHPPRNLGRLKRPSKRFLCKAIKSNAEPTKINIDKSGANNAGINDYNDDEGIDIEVRQSKYLNNIIEQDRRPIKPLCRAILGFSGFERQGLQLAVLSR